MSATHILGVILSTLSRGVDGQEEDGEEECGKSHDCSLKSDFYSRHVLAWRWETRLDRQDSRRAREPRVAHMSFKFQSDIN